MRRDPMFDAIAKRRSQLKRTRMAKSCVSSICYDGHNAEAAIENISA